MTHLITQVNSERLWHSLVDEAKTTCAINLSDSLTCYLVSLLASYSLRADLGKIICAVELLKGLKLANGSQKRHVLGQVGDTCLLVAGLFPGLADRRHVRISYFIHLGQSAYAHIAIDQQDIYAILAKHFVVLVDVLQAIRQADPNIPTLLPFQAYDLWCDTGSPRALQILKQYSSGPSAFIMAITDQHEKLDNIILDPAKNSDLFNKKSNTSS